MSNPIIEVASVDELKRLLTYPSAIVCYSKNNCPPCSMIYRSLEQVAGKEREKPVLFIVAKMEVVGTEFLESQGIRSLPTLISYQKAEAVQSKIGFQSPAAIEALI